jgi:Protein of unknown function (DUF2917)
MPHLDHALCAPLPYAAGQLPAHTGAFALHAGRAISLKPSVASQLRIAQGGAWVTLPSQPGDHFLQAGDVLRVDACDALVMEAWQMPQSQTLYFDWDPVPMHIPAASAVVRRGWLRAAVPSPRPRMGYCAAVLAPLADLRAALVLGAGALARLASGLLGLALGLAVGKLADSASFLAASRARSNTL